MISAALIFCSRLLTDIMADLYVQKSSSFAGWVVKMVFHAF